MALVMTKPLSAQGFSLLPQLPCRLSWPHRPVPSEPPSTPLPAPGDSLETNETVASLCFTSQLVYRGGWQPNSILAPLATALAVYQSLYPIFPPSRLFPSISPVPHLIHSSQRFKTFNQPRKIWGVARRSLIGIPSVRVTCPEWRGMRRRVTGYLIHWTGNAIQPWSRPPTRSPISGRLQCACAACLVAIPYQSPETGRATLNTCCTFNT